MEGDNAGVKYFGGMFKKILLDADKMMRLHAGESSAPESEDARKSMDGAKKSDRDLHVEEFDAEDPSSAHTESTRTHAQEQNVEPDGMEPSCAGVWHEEENWKMEQAASKMEEVFSITDIPDADSDAFESNLCNDNNSEMELKLELSDDEDTPRDEDVAGEVSHACFDVSTVGNEEAANRFSCHVCNESLSSRENLKDHLEAVHLQQKFGCKTCGKQFIRPKCLDNHVTKCHTGDKKCATCEKTFNLAEELDLHKSTCTKKQSRENKPQTVSSQAIESSCQEIFSCDECLKEFVSERKLNVHLKSAHQQTVMYRCAVCRKTFSLTHELISHFKVEHWRKDAKT